jgi:hypothetical protein
MLDREMLHHFALALALLGALLLLVDFWLHRVGASNRFRRSRDIGLAVVGLVATLSWWDPLLLPRAHNPPGLHWVSLTDSFHYYMGPKYFRELGYFDLYECVAGAEVELGAGAEVARRVYRDLSTNQPVPGGRLRAAGRECRQRFTPARWEVFVHDVDWFRQRVPHWGSTMQDWGYNATPIWNALGSALIDERPVSETQLGWLSLLDVALIWACFALIAWGFGWRTACVASIFWGTHVANAYAWTGGSILRHAWLLASVAGLCLLRRQKPVAAGAAITGAACLTIFPGFLAFGIGLKTIGTWFSERRLFLSPEHRRLLLGAALALAVLLPAALLSGGTPPLWRDFVINSRIDSEPSPNNMGLPTVLSYDPKQTLRAFELVDPMGAGQSWTASHKATLESRWLFWAVLVAGWLSIAFGAARRHPDWVAAVLGLGFLVFAFELSCYYYAFMLLFGLLWPRHRSIGIALCGLAAASLWLGDRWLDEEDLYTRLSLWTVAFVAYSTIVLRIARPESEAAA